ACAEGAAPEAPSSPRMPDGARPAADSERTERVPPGLEEIEGSIATDLDEPVVGRPIVIVDAYGKRFETRSAEGGSFRVSGVAPPYDLAIAHAPSGDVVVPTVFFGLSRI